MFNSFYGLTKNPFDKQQVSEDDCFRSQDFEQLTARLNFLKETRGIGVFTARPGMGKSYALRCFAKTSIQTSITWNISAFPPSVPPISIKNSVRSWV